MTHLPFIRDRKAAVAVMFAAAVVPILGFTGLAIDFGVYNQVKAKLNLAAHSAALNAINVESAAFAAGQTDFQAQGKAAGDQWFAAQLGSTIAHSATNVVGVVSVPTPVGTTFTSMVAYSANVPTYFAGLFGYTSFTVKGAVGTTITMNAYTANTLLLDNSGSMLIASTPAGVIQMQNAATSSAFANGIGQGGNCGFACHWSATKVPANGSDGAFQDYYGVARSNNIELRFDVVQSATVTVVNSMSALEAIPNQFSLGVWMFNSYLTQVFPSAGGGYFSTDLVSGLAAVKGIITPVVANSGDTDFPAAMATLASKLPTGGDGSTPTFPRLNMFIVTDGIQDFAPRTKGASMGPLTVASCDAIKAKNIQIYVLYTPYTPLPANGFYNSNIKPYVESPPTPTLAVVAMQNCASSPNNFYQANDPTQIGLGLQKLFKAANRTPGRFAS